MTQREETFKEEVDKVAIAFLLNAMPPETDEEKGEMLAKYHDNNHSQNLNTRAQADLFIQSFKKRIEERASFGMVPFYETMGMLNRKPDELGKVAALILNKFNFLTQGNLNSDYRERYGGVIGSSAVIQQRYLGRLIKEARSTGTIKSIRMRRFRSLVNMMSYLCISKQIPKPRSYYVWDEVAGDSSRVLQTAMVSRKTDESLGDSRTRLVVIGNVNTIEDPFYAPFFTANLAAVYDSILQVAKDSATTMRRSPISLARTIATFGVAKKYGYSEDYSIIPTPYLAQKLEAIENNRRFGV